jgi:hypothetical protein
MSFWKFIAAAARIALIAFPAAPYVPPRVCSNDGQSIAMTEANQSMARIDQPRQIYLKQLPLRRLRLALGSHRFSPAFQAIGSAFWEILAQPIPRFIRFYRGLIGFSGSYFCLPSSPPNTRCPFTPACCTGSALSLGVGGDASPADGTKFFQ